MQSYYNKILNTVNLQEQINSKIHNIWSCAFVGVNRVRKSIHNVRYDKYENTNRVYFI